MPKPASLLSFVTHAVLLALTGLMLVIVGCTGAQASSGNPAASGSTYELTSTALDIHAVAVPVLAVTTGLSLPSTAQLPNTVLSPGTDARPAWTTCVPGRDKVRLEQNALTPVSAHLQRPPSALESDLLTPARADGGADQFADRVPAALTHLDLGIVRT
ncbi:MULTISPECIES: hypothetical protein [Arthrobacter]|uniref:hypothetical protein n=1 Tax=unclassified Arthrobacter TaxID=235627 RepID=UPI0024B9F6B4|nr:hypothetical protein [Arthrobacter sp. H35-MC1]MDJ0317296.1 hypothetical protein [Arthrobacter sp. H35-MC1]